MVFCLKLKLFNIQWDRDMARKGYKCHHFLYYETIVSISLVIITHFFLLQIEMYLLIKKLLVLVCHYCIWFQMFEKNYTDGDDTGSGLDRSKIV